MKRESSMHDERITTPALLKMIERQSEYCKSRFGRKGPWSHMVLGVMLDLKDCRDEIDRLNWGDDDAPRRTQPRGTASGKAI